MNVDILTLITAILFNGSIGYGYLKQCKFPTSISALWYTDINLIYRFTVMGIAALLMAQLEPFMVLAGLSLIGLLVFPKINKPKEKRIHDMVAVLAFVFMSLNVHWIFVFVLTGLFFSFRKLLSLYWLEIIGLNILMISKLLL